MVLPRFSHSPSLICGSKTSWIKDFLTQKQDLFIRVDFFPMSFVYLLFEATCLSTYHILWQKRCPGSDQKT